MSSEENNPEDYRPDQIQLKKPKARKNEQLWLMTFSDLSFVLLCFFVLLFSFSKTDQKKFDNVRNGMTAKTSDVKMKKKPKSLKTLSDRIEKVINEKKLKHVAEVTYDADGVSVEFKNRMLFSSGSASTTPKHRKMVGQVLRVIANSPKKYHLTIEGHTDDVPMRSAKFRSNWELSAARGISLLKEFTRRGIDTQRMSVLALAHTRPKVTYRGLKGERLRQARAANRRVVIRIR